MLFLETIRCKNGRPLHLPYHQKRLEKTLLANGSSASYELSSLISPPSEGIYRCRFLYDTDSSHIEFHPYFPRRISSLKLICSDTIDYAVKYADRSALDLLYAQRGECDDVLILKNGMLTDTTIANVALMIEGQWLTPDTPLLQGTTRERLIHEGFLKPAPLSLADLRIAEKIAVMNAMMGFIEVENGIIA